jgi:Ca-activated chloride channel family protein
MARAPKARGIPHSSEQERNGAHPAAGFNTEAYDRIYENPFTDPVRHHMSTFSIDVDTASYSNVRRFLTQGSLPYQDAVRIEELVNYFTYDYRKPEGDTPFAFHNEISECPWNADHILLHIGLQAEQVPSEDLPPANLVFLLDVSGSMNAPNKLPLLKSSLELLVGQLREQDRVAIAVYAGAAGLVLPPTAGSDQKTIVGALKRLQAGGSTAGGAGIRLAYRVAGEHFDPEGNNRVILATDGDFNVGASSDGELVRLIEEKREQGIFLTVLGFGTGNYKDSKMEKLADKGNGNYAYIDSLLEAKKVLVSEMGGTLLTVAKDVKIQVEFNPARVKSYRLLGYENRVLRDEDFDDDRKDAGELGAGHSVTALYEIEPAGDRVSLVGAGLKYQTVQLKPDAARSPELATIKFRYKTPQGQQSTLIVHPIADERVSLRGASADFKFSAAVVEWGLLLRSSEHKAGANYGQVRNLASQGIGEDRFGYRRELLRLVELSQGLAGES